MNPRIDCSELPEKCVARRVSSPEDGAMSNVVRLCLPFLCLLSWSGCADAGQSGTEGGSIRACTLEVARRTLAPSEVEAMQPPVVLTTLDQVPAEGKLGWVDASGMRQFTTAHV